MVLWSVTVACLCILWLFLAIRFDPQKAIGAVVLLCCLVPTWVRIDFLGESLDVRLAVSIFSLLAYCLHPAATFPWRLGLLDASMLMLVLVNLFSDVENTGWSWMIPIQAYAEWVIPYIAGRLALHDLGNMKFLAPFGLAVAVVLMVGSVFESVTWLHPWEWVYGERLYDGIARDSQRWGFLRAWGCCAHPIFFGVLQVAMLPWVFLTLFQCRRGGWNWILLLLPFFALFGIAATGSRAPILAFLISASFSIFYLLPRIRIPFGIAIAALVIVVAINRDRVIELTRSWGGEVVDRETNRVVVDEKEVVMSGTLSRLHVLKMYRRAVIRAGWIGFGSESVSGFPVNVPLGPEDQTAIRKIRFIDNQYLLLTLRFGWLGVVFFTLALGLTVLAWLMRATVATSDEDQAMCVFFASGVFSIAIAILTVWMPHDIGFPLIWIMGAASASNRSLY